MPLNAPTEAYRGTWTSKGFLRNGSCASEYLPSLQSRTEVPPMPLKLKSWRWESTLAYLSCLPRSLQISRIFSKLSTGNINDSNGVPRFDLGATASNGLPKVSRPTFGTPRRHHELLSSWTKNNRNRSEECPSDQQSPSSKPLGTASDVHRMFQHSTNAPLGQQRDSGSCEEKVPTDF